MGRPHGRRERHLVAALFFFALTIKKIEKKIGSDYTITMITIINQQVRT
jgi:hypothetical protein